MVFSQRFAAAVAASSLLLSATPVSAMSLGFGMGMGVDERTEHSESETHMEMKQDDSMMKKGEMMRSDAAVSMTLEERMSTRFMNVMKRTIYGFVKFSKKVCNASGDQSTVAACMDKAKVDLKASISAMIDAAFGA